MKKRILSALLSAVLALSLTVPAFAAYRDVPASHWAASDIQYVTERGLFKGTGGDTFGPSEKMSRVMLATVLYRYAGSPTVNETTPYVDVAAGAWYMPGVAWAYQNSIFPSMNLSRTMLYPNEDIRRAEFCIMLYNFAKSLGKASADSTAMERPPFTDVEWNRFSMAGFGPIYNEVREAMLGWAWPVGIMNGTTETTINPLGSITRAEVAAMLARFDRNVMGGTEAIAQLPSVVPEPGPVPSVSENLTILFPYITEESVLAALALLEERYPHTATYPTPYRSTSGGPYSRGTNCSGWASLCSDAVFGDLPWRRVDNPSWDQIRPGDLLEYQNDLGRHVVVAINRTEDILTYTDSGTSQKVYWGSSVPRWWVESRPGLILYTRYPN